MAVSIGADPEILLMDRDGRFKSAVGLVGGTKEKPVPIPGMDEWFSSGSAMQEDNVMLEFNVIPSRSVDQFVGNIYTTISNLDENVLNPRSLLMSHACYGEYRVAELQSPQAQQFGCSPDMDAYDAEGKTSVVNPADVGNLRFAGGHIHLGYDNPENVPDFVVVQLCDALLGLHEIYHNKKGQGQRRQFYGTAGRYRPKPYGIEYRTLSNVWLWQDELLRNLAQNAFRVARMVDTGNVDAVHRLYTEIPFQEVRNIINTEDRKAAANMIRFINTVDREAA